MKPKTREVKLRYPMPTDVGGFGVDPEDSERLRRLRSIIDDDIGWASPEEEEIGNYEARLRQIAAELPQLRALNKRMRDQLVAEQAARRRAERRRP